MHFLINYLTNQGYATQDIVLVLMLPLLMTLLSLARQIIGIRGLGLVATLMMAIVLSMTGLKSGLILIILTVLVVTLLRWLTLKWRLVYLPRTAVILVLTLVILLVLTIIPLPLKQKIPLLALALIVIIAEKVILVEMEKSQLEALFQILETLILAIIGYGLILWRPLQNIILARPDALIITVLMVNLVLGKWTGLRLNEYWRFKKVIKNVEMPEKH